MKFLCYVTRYWDLHLIAFDPIFMWCYHGAEECDRIKQPTVLEDLRQVQMMLIQMDTIQSPSNQLKSLLQN